jgi:response regulator of citrate/malate metabolism
LNSKFDDLLAKFEKLREDNAITQTELDRLKSEIASFKINAETFPKGTFVRTTFNRLRRIITSEKTKEVVKDLITSAVKTTMGLPY